MKTNMSNSPTIIAKRKCVHCGTIIAQCSDGHYIGCEHAPKDEPEHAGEVMYTPHQVLQMRSVILAKQILNRGAVQ